MRRLLIIGVLGIMAFLPLMAEDVVYLTTEQFRARVFDYRTEREWKYKGDQPCVIDFYTTWCGPCKRLAPIMEELSQKYCGQVVFYKMDIEREREVAYLFGISSIPQVLYVPVEGMPSLEKGLYPKEMMVSIIDDLVKKAEAMPKNVTPVEEEKPKTEEKKSIWQRWIEKFKYRTKK